MRLPRLPVSRRRHERALARLGELRQRLIEAEACLAELKHDLAGREADGDH